METQKKDTLGSSLPQKNRESDIVTQLLEMMELLKERTSWKAVFGEPLVHGETTIVPVARICFGMGAGMGQAEEKPASEAPPAGGGGGGGGGVSRPIALIEMSPSGVRVRPIIEWGKVMLAGLLTLAWVVTLWTSLLRKYLNAKG